MVSDMSTFDTGDRDRDRDWNRSEYSRLALGDEDRGSGGCRLPGVRSPTHTANIRSLLCTRSAVDKTVTITQRAILMCLAWWAPLLQLLFFGSGWVRPDLGLARWFDLGQPDDDPVLKIVKRWWGSQVLDVLAWSSCTNTLTEMAAQVGTVTHTAAQRISVPDRWPERRREPNWGSVWGSGSDPMHLSVHTLSAHVRTTATPRPHP